MMQVILISGKSGSGKDTFANMLKILLEQMGKKVLITHFADPVKWIARDYFNWNGVKDISGRSLLQKLGTDQVRAHDKNYWVDIISRFIAVMGECKEFDYVLIPDARFENEITGVCFRNPGAISIRIDRYENGYPWLNPALNSEQATHPSETSLDNYKYFNYKIKNDKGLLELEEKAANLIKEMEGLGECY